MGNHSAPGKVASFSPPDKNVINLFLEKKPGKGRMLISDGEELNWIKPKFVEEGLIPHPVAVWHRGRVVFLSSADFHSPSTNRLRRLIEKRMLVDYFMSPPGVESWDSQRGRIS